MAGREENALARERGGGLRVGMQIYGGGAWKGLQAKAGAREVISV